MSLRGHYGNSMLPEHKRILDRLGEYSSKKESNPIYDILLDYAVYDALKIHPHIREDEIPEMNELLKKLAEERFINIYDDKGRISHTDPAFNDLHINHLLDNFRKGLLQTT